MSDAEIDRLVEETQLPHLELGATNRLRVAVKSHPDEARADAERRALDIWVMVRDRAGCVSVEEGSVSWEEYLPGFPFVMVAAAVRRVR